MGEAEAPSPTAALPKPTEADVALPDLAVLEVNKLLHVTGFTKLCLGWCQSFSLGVCFLVVFQLLFGSVRLASNTEATRPIFLRKHLLDVHKVAVDVLSASVEEDAKRLVSLVGCPGTGKTWCGWLVAHALQKAKKRTLHVTIRGNEVIVVSEFKKKASYAIEDWKYYMLKQLPTENQCDVCIIDVGNKTPAESIYIFQGVRTILESSAEPKPFPKVKFMGMVSGHDEETIVGKEARDRFTQRLVLWSWSENEFNAYRKAIKTAGAAKLEETIYSVCGGSVRYWFDPEEDQSKIDRDIQKLPEQDLERFLTPDHRPTSNTNHHEHSRLLAFFRNPDRLVKGTRKITREDDFKRGVVSAYIVPRSDYVIRSIRAHKKGTFSQMKKMYEALLPLNPGAAGTPFEILVHYFWEECINEKGNIQLSLTDKDGQVQTTIVVKCAELKPVAECEPVGHWDNKGSVDTNLFGYFTPNNKSNYPRLDSILRYKSGRSAKVLAIQVSIGEEHTQGAKPKNALLQEKLAKGEKTKLALWDHRDKGRKCVWKSHASEDWELVYVRCRKFDDKMRHS